MVTWTYGSALDMDRHSAIEAHRRMIAAASPVEVTGLLHLLRQRTADFGWRNVVQRLEGVLFAAGRCLGRECRDRVE